MLIPLRELALVILLVPTAIGMEWSCHRADILWTALQGEQGLTLPPEVRGRLFARSACTEESMLIGWDIQLQMQMQADSRLHKKVPPGEPVAYARSPL